MEAWEKVKSALVASGFEAVTGRKHDTYSGALDVGSVEVRVEISISDYQFNTLPTVHIRNRSELPQRLTAHMMSNDSLCYADKATFLLDMFAPDASIMRVLAQAKATLSTLLHGNATPEFMAEFAAYWSSLGYCLIDDPWKLSELAFGTCDFGDGPQMLICGKSKKRLNDWTARAKGKFKHHFTAPVVIAVGDVRPPPRSDLNLDVAVEWLEPQVKTSGRLLDLVCGRSGFAPALVVVATNAIIGFQVQEPPLIQQAKRKGFRQQSIPSLWKSNASDIKLETFYCSNSSADEITSRNINGTSSLAEQSIALVGCGTIGGYLARSLVQLGVGSKGRLLLIDKDTLKPENLGRHSLGVRSLWKNKAKAVQDEIVSDFPDVQINAAASSGEVSLGRLRAYDLVIDATGDEQFSNTLNAYAISQVRNSGKFPPIQYVMIFGNGIAAQSFISSHDPSKACFRCLKPRLDGQWRNNPVKPSAGEVEIVVRPCAQSSFAPFAVSASLASAALATQHTMDFFSTGYQSDLRTVCIDPMNGKSIPWKSIAASPDCPACS